MEFKNLKTPIYSSDLYYDLLDGGYISPKALLKSPADVKLVEDAMSTIREFLDAAIDQEILEVG